MSTPTRIQLSRKKGWKLPENTVVVSRPSRWGNPFVVGQTIERLGGAVDIRDQSHAVRLYRRWLHTQKRSEDMVPLLKGKNLACWCKPGTPCHADVLLEIANS